MAITTQDGLVAAMAASQQVLYRKTTGRTVVADNWFGLLDVAGSPGAGVLAGTNTANGLVPTDATTGFPPINAFAGANIGYITGIEYGNTLTSRLRLVDYLFKAGAYAFNASTTLASQPSYSSRIPGADYKGTEIWFEAATAFTGNPTVTVTYTNQDGTAARSTGAVALGFAPIVGRMYQLPLQAGDTGVQKIESVTATVASAGTFNILVLRPLWMGRVRATGDGDVHGPDKTDLPVIYADSALGLLVCSDTAGQGNIDAMISVGNG